MLVLQGVKRASSRLRRASTEDETHQPSETQTRKIDGLQQRRRPVRQMPGNGDHLLPRSCTFGL
jgi:hypothetical protein